MFKIAFVVALLPLFVSASPQIYGPPPPPAPTVAAVSTSSAAAIPSAPANSQGVINVNVGLNEGFAYSPSDITAPNGTVINFFFTSPDIPHTVVQSNGSSAPCTPLETLNNTSVSGFDSGMTLGGNQFSLTIVDDSMPVYFFCKVPLHCGMGMVGTINAPSNGTGSFAELQSAATAIGANEADVSAGGFKAGGIGASASASPSSASAAASPTTTTGSTSGADRLFVSGSVGLVVVAVVMTLAF